MDIFKESDKITKTNKKISTISNILSWGLILFAFKNYITNSHWNIIIILLWIAIVGCLSYLSSGNVELNFKELDLGRAVYRIILQNALPLFSVVISYNINSFWSIGYIMFTAAYINLLNAEIASGNDIKDKVFINITSLIGLYILYYVFVHYSALNNTVSLLGLKIWMGISIVFCMVLGSFFYKSKRGLILAQICIPFMGIINTKYSPASFLHGWWIVYVISSAIYFLAFALTLEDLK